MMSPFRSTPTHVNEGSAAERAAAQWLISQGLKLLDSNFRCKGGEIDLIMQDDTYLVFIEVRLRNRDDFGGALASVTQKKQQRVIHAAQMYIAQHARFSNAMCRFDVVAAKYIGDHLTWSWVKDAFLAG